MAYEKIAIGDIGTQLFWFNKTAGKFEYAFPVTAGAEFGGDTESFDAPETDLDYVPKIGGRKTLNDITYTVNYTKEKYARARDITDIDTAHTYMEVFSDGSAEIFMGTANDPSITAGDVRQFTVTVIPSYMLWVSDIYNLDADTEIAEMPEDSGWYTGTSLNIDVATIPSNREYWATKEAQQ